VKPEEQEIRGIVSNSVQNFSSTMIPPKLAELNSKIKEYLARISISSLVTY